MPFRRATNLSPWKSRTGLTIEEVLDLITLGELDDAADPVLFAVLAIESGNRRARGVADAVEMVMMIAYSEDRCEDSPAFAIDEAESHLGDIEYTTAFDVACMIDPEVEYAYREMQEALDRFASVLHNALDDLDYCIQSEL